MIDEITIKATEFSGLKLVYFKIINDDRGRFIKTYQKSFFSKILKGKEFVENYFSISKENVIRGMHFQKPPADHIKFVYVSYGEIEDVVVDIREDSSTYKKVFNVQLDANKGVGVLIPPGFAHGFKVGSKTAIVHYLQTSEYSSRDDMGILWDSISFDWDIMNPLISERDKSFLTLEEFMKMNQVLKWEV